MNTTQQTQVTGAAELLLDAVKHGTQESKSHALRALAHLLDRLTFDTSVLDHVNAETATLWRALRRAAAEMQPVAEGPWRTETLTSGGTWLLDRVFTERDHAGRREAALRTKGAVVRVVAHVEQEVV